MTNAVYVVVVIQLWLIVSKKVMSRSSIISMPKLSVGKKNSGLLMIVH